MPSRFRVAVGTILCPVGDLVRMVAGVLRSRAPLSAENLFLRKQLALYVERQVKPRRADDATRITLVVLSWVIDWRRVLTVVKSDTLIRWHRKGFQLCWRWKSRPRGRPRLPADLRHVIAEMASANRTWGEKRIASELLVKLGVHVSPRTVRRYMATTRAPRDGAQRWSTFVRNHASAVLACDFFMVVTATFRVFYVFVVLEIGSRRIRHWNVTEHPTADWTAQQFRTVMSGDEPVRCVNSICIK
jgi:putative transposase